ncbi:tRNA-dihydrouridine synthase [Ornithinimicrobium sp. Y1847]|uniref:tRNA-dihydrouridine synthase n=1 Tax=Ornithinimicrobium sp. Y1847 TaxID=3405419 RepID=UPI003B6803CB
MRTLPPIWLGPGAITDPRALARFGDLVDVPLPVGPVEAGSRRSRPGRTTVHGIGVGGIDHDDCRSVGVPVAEDLLAWAGTRGLTVCVGLRGASTGDLAAVLDRLRRSPHGDALAAVEVDLRMADDQWALRCMARVRESSPRHHLLLARLGIAAPDLVSRARAAVAGGATAIVVDGAVPLGSGRWWSGPATAAHTRAGLRALRAAAAEQRWPGAPLIAAGGIHDPASARAALDDGASAVQLGSALWADPTLLWEIRDTVREHLAAHFGGRTDRAGTRHTGTGAARETRVPG